MQLAVMSTHSGQQVRANVTGQMEGAAWWEANVLLAGDATFLLPAFAPLAGRLRVPLRVYGAVDAVAIEGARSALDLLACWFGPLSAVEVTANSVTSTVQPVKARTACFFSGGVDSWFSVLTHRAELDALVFVHGFDIRIDDEDLAARVLASVRASAETLSLPLIEVRTDIRVLTDPSLRWAEECHGAALATVAHLLADHVDTVLSPATYPAGDTRHWGSHAQLDPLWSSSGVRLVHDGAPSRAGKIAAVTDSPLAMEHLRVCWENRAGAFNCGRCEKCLRMMANLRIVGAEGRCATLPARLDLAALTAVPPSESAGKYAAASLAELDRRGGDPELDVVLPTIVRRVRAQRVRRWPRAAVKLALEQLGLWARGDRGKWHSENWVGRASAQAAGQRVSAHLPSCTLAARTHGKRAVCLSSFGTRRLRCRSCVSSSRAAGGALNSGKRR